MQARRRCILDGVGISVQRILVSICLSHNSSRLMATDVHVGFICGLACYGLPHLALWLPILSFVCTTLRLARRERNDVHSHTYPPMITQCCTPSSLPAGQLQLSALSVSGARPYGANANTGTRLLPGAYHGASCGGARQYFKWLRSWRHCVLYSAFSLRLSLCVCARVCGWRDGSGASGGDVSRSGVLHASEATMHS